MSTRVTQENHLASSLDGLSPEPLWDDPLTALLAVAWGTPPFKEGFLGVCNPFVAANELVKWNQDDLLYDRNGNLTTQQTLSGTMTYSWDARNRLTSLNGPGVSASFVYDALDRRISKTINGTTTQYLYDGNDIVAEIGGGAVATTYLRSLNIDEPFVRQSATNEYYHTDALGSVLALTDQTGAPQTTYRYDPFGNMTVTGTSSSPFSFTGRENDGTGLYYYRNRYYSPVLQRFTTEDPLHSPLRKMSGLSCQGNYAPNISWYLDVDPGLALLMMSRFYEFANSFAVDPKQLHLYTYVYNNPVSKIDPEGLYADPQTPGCDQFPDFNRCATQCCNEHDDCYKRAALSRCTSRTWLEQYFPYGKYGSRTRVECEECNSTVVRCIARATWHWGSRRKDPC